MDDQFSSCFYFEGFAVAIQLLSIRNRPFLCQSDGFGCRIWIVVIMTSTWTQNGISFVTPHDSSWCEKSLQALRRTWPEPTLAPAKLRTDWPHKCRWSPQPSCMCSEITNHCIVLTSLYFIIFQNSSSMHIRTFSLILWVLVSNILC